MIEMTSVLNKKSLIKYLGVKFASSNNNAAKSRRFYFNEPLIQDTRAKMTAQQCGPSGNTDAAAPRVRSRP